MPSARGFRPSPYGSSSPYTPPNSPVPSSQAAVKAFRFTLQFVGEKVVVAFDLPKTDNHSSESAKVPLADLDLTSHWQGKYGGYITYAGSKVWFSGQEVAKLQELQFEALRTGGPKRLPDRFEMVHSRNKRNQSGYVIKALVSTMAQTDMVGGRRRRFVDLSIAQVVLYPNGRAWVAEGGARWLELTASDVKALVKIQERIQDAVECQSSQSSKFKKRKIAYSADAAEKAAEAGYETGSDKRMRRSS